MTCYYLNLIASISKDTYLILLGFFIKPLSLLVWQPLQNFHSMMYNERVFPLKLLGSIPFRLSKDIPKILFSLHLNAILDFGLWSLEFCYERVEVSWGLPVIPLRVIHTADAAVDMSILIWLFQSVEAWQDLMFPRTICSSPTPYLRCYIKFSEVRRRWGMQLVEFDSTSRTCKLLYSNPLWPSAVGLIVSRLELLLSLCVY